MSGACLRMRALLVCLCVEQDNNTPLHYAAYNGHLSVCKTLVRAVGAETDYDVVLGDAVGC